MSSKTKIMVLHMREVIYTGIFLVLGIILIILMLVMFRPKPTTDGTTVAPSSDESTQTSALVPEAATYRAGVYTTPITINDNAIDVEVTVDTDHINSIRLVNLSESITTMYPLMQPVLENLAAQICETQSLDHLQYASDSRYTSEVLLEAIRSSLHTAAAPDATE